MAILSAPGRRCKASVGICLPAMRQTGIGWIYWAYNRRFFTVYQPGKNRPFLGYNPGVIPGPGPAEEEPLDRRMLDALFGAHGP